MPWLDPPPKSPCEDTVCQPRSCGGRSEQRSAKGGSRYGVRERSGHQGCREPACRNAEVDERKVSHEAHLLKPPVASINRENGEHLKASERAMARQHSSLQGLRQCHAVPERDRGSLGSDVGSNVASLDHGRMDFYRQTCRKLQR